MQEKRGNWGRLNFWISKNFLAGLRQVWAVRGFLVFSVAFFAFAAVLGFVFPVFFVEQIKALIKQILLQIGGLSGFGLIAFIFTNNLRSSFIGAMSGVFSGAVPLIMLLVNGYLLGFVANKTVSLAGLGVLWKLLPHGVFELPAVFISTGLGLHLGVSMTLGVIQKFVPRVSRVFFCFLVALSMIFFPIAFYVVFIFTMSDKELRKRFKVNLVNLLRIFLLIVVPLLLIAAVIEGTLIAVMA